MIHILLLILKIIGIVLLATLVLLLLALFYPIMYRVKAEIKGKSGTGDVVAHWLFHLVHFRLNYKGNKVVYVLRILGIPIISSNKKKRDKNKKTAPKTSQKKTDKLNTIESQEKNDSSGEKSTSEQLEGKQDTSTNNIKHQKDEAVNQNEITLKSKISNKIKTIVSKIKLLIEKIKKFIHQCVDNTKAANNKIKEIKSFITANTTKEAYNYGKRLVVKLIKHILPRRIKADVKFGFEEPHVTGQALGYIAMAFGTFGISPKKISITPDFENKVFEGKGKCRGHILLGVVVIYILKFYFKKEIHDIIRKFS